MSKPRPQNDLQSLVDRRLNPRKRARYRLDVADASGTHVGYVVDISPAGMRVRCEPQLDIAGTSVLRIVFPRWLGLGDSLKVPGRFVWCRPNPPGNEGGYAFADLRRKQQAKLESLIDQLSTAATDYEGGDEGTSEHVADVGVLAELAEDAEPLLVALRDDLQVHGAVLPAAARVREA